jgi:hypothetical protein
MLARTTSGLSSALAWIIVSCSDERALRTATATSRRAIREMYFTSILCPIVTPFQHSRCRHSLMSPAPLARGLRGPNLGWGCSRIFPEVYYPVKRRCKRQTKLSITHKYRNVG